MHEGEHWLRSQPIRLVEDTPEWSATESISQEELSTKDAEDTMFITEESVNNNKPVEAKDRTFGDGPRR